MKWNEWLLIGAGLAFGGVIGATTVAILLPNARWIGGDGRLQWETLATGLLAATAAFATVQVMRRTISQNDRQEAERRSRRERAARATLPLALSKLCEYATLCMKGVERIRECVDEQGNLDRKRAREAIANWTLPELPADTLSVVKGCIEHSDDQIAEAMAELIRQLQVQNSRLTGNLARIRSLAPGGIVLSFNIDTALVDAAAIHARCEALFPYARGTPTDTALPQANDIRRALWLARVDETKCRQAYENASRWQPPDWSALCHLDAFKSGV